MIEWLKGFLLTEEPCPRVADHAAITPALCGPEPDATEFAAMQCSFALLDLIRDGII